ncbi:hypothetical protein [Abyssogena phaseoliformis symbiont]|uniref:hypothetical protein n=1 Tax=Abyssogena phaseoliformis symbiont TaxID=596095 RepID=UPI001916833F|nr:hypothetical protein [Abyssogena phaseoliformis symbiont]MBW5288896.1 hypothetical protein [Candidatus Ruthia sp. Apha_13_S6]
MSIDNIDNIDFRDGYNPIKKEFKPINKEVFNLFSTAQKAFNELNYPQNNSEYQVLTTSVNNQITTKKFYKDDDAITYLQDMQIEAENPHEKILKLELVELK